MTTYQETGGSALLIQSKPPRMPTDSVDSAGDVFNLVIAQLAFALLV
jgi:hypothetical protein